MEHHPVSSLKTKNLTNPLSSALHCVLAWLFNVALFGLPVYRRAQGLPIREEAERCKGAYDEWAERQEALVAETAADQRLPMPDSVVVCSCGHGLHMSSAAQQSGSPSSCLFSLRLSSK